MQMIDMKGISILPSGRYRVRLQRSNQKIKVLRL
jgi:hypothetical protein